MNKKWLYILSFCCLILNIVIDVNIKNYVEIVNQCFGKEIVLSHYLYILICFIIALISVLIIADVILVFHKKETENEGINLKEKDGTYRDCKLDE